LGCGARFTTYERAELSVVMVVKKDGRREAFNRVKVAGSIYQAIGKRPVLTSAAEELISGIEREVRSMQEVEVGSKKIGELVMNGLKDLDDVAYVRFASVYCSFTCVAHIEAELRRLRQNRAAANAV
jgi:transcriptional repressor NrdR